MLEEHILSGCSSRLLTARRVEKLRGISSNYTQDSRPFAGLEQPGRKMSAANAASVAASPSQRRLARYVLLGSLSRTVARALRDPTPRDASSEGFDGGLAALRAGDLAFLFDSSDVHLRFLQLLHNERYLGIFVAGVRWSRHAGLS